MMATNQLLYYVFMLPKDGGDGLSPLFIGLDNIIIMRNLKLLVRMVVGGCG